MGPQSVAPVVLLFVGFPTLTGTLTAALAWAGQGDKAGTDADKTNYAKLFGIGALVGEGAMLTGYGLAKLPPEGKLITLGTLGGGIAGGFKASAKQSDKTPAQRKADNESGKTINEYAQEVGKDAAIGLVATTLPIVAVKAFKSKLHPPDTSELRRRLPNDPWWRRTDLRSFRYRGRTIIGLGW